MKEFFKDTTNRILVSSSLILNLGLFLFFLFFIKQNNIPIVLHYNVDWGVDYLGEIKSIFTLPIVGALILLFNTFLVLKIWKESKIASYFLIVTAFLMQVFLVISGITLYVINR